jgi:hypothetical protein
MSGSTNIQKLTLFDRQVFETFIHPGEVVEVRVLGAHGKAPAWGGEWARGSVSGYFDDQRAFCKVVQDADKARHSGIYFTLQVIDPRLIGRAFNRLKPTSVSTADHNIIAYRWVPIDIDPVRPSGIASSNAELKKAMVLRDRMAEEISQDRGWPAPIEGMSGNGGHLLYALGDMPANEQTTIFIKGVLFELAQKYDSPAVKIDQTVFNPARIWKLYGTTARKGDEVPTGPNREARPHRMSYISSMGDR